MNIKTVFNLLYVVTFLNVAYSAHAETKQLYGIAGPKLVHQQISDESYSYEVKGVIYTTKPKNQAKEYVKEGLASYYHSDFQGRRTSSGELYDNAKYTAAHKTLPINSYAVVTNLNNKRKVIVRINDRGPFSGKRIIDLSNQAAKEIGLIARGVGQVKIEALHVDRKGKISGVGVETLAKNATDKKNLILEDEKLAKTSVKVKKDAKETKNDLLANNKKDAKSKKMEKEDVLVAKNSLNSKKAVENVKPTKVSLKNEKDNYLSLRVANASSRKDVDDIIKKLALKNVKAEVERNGKGYNVKLASLNSKNELEQIKRKITKLDSKQKVILYTYNN